VEASLWEASRPSLDSLGSLAQLLGHFVPCSDSARLSRLGLVDGEAHIVLVPDRQLLVEVKICDGRETPSRNLRVPATLRLAELGSLLEQSLRESEQEQPASEAPCDRGLCAWALASTVEAWQAEDRDEGEPGSQGVVASMVDSMVSLSTGRRRSFGRRPSEATSSPPLKRRRSLSLGQVRSEARTEALLSSDAFVGDIFAAQPAGQRVLPAHYLCPISYDVMRDPVIVSGSGNTYDRKSIERHFQHKHTDPISNSELRRASDRRLVPNNALRSQVDEAERSQVDLRLAALYGACRPQDSARGGYLGWCASLLRGST